MNKAILAALAATMLMVGCDQGAGSSPTPRPIGDLAFKAHDAELINSKVEVYSVDEYLKPIGEPISEGLTGEDARFHFKPNVRSQNLYVKVGMTGHYFEESTGKKIELEPTDYLSGIIYYQAGDTLDFTVSGYTHLASTYAQCLIERYGENANNAMTAASSAFTNLVGTDIYDTIPVNPSLNASAGLQLEGGTSYGIVHAAVSQFMKRIAEDQSIEPHITNYRSIDYYRFAARDISEDRNCALDGKIQDKDGTTVDLGLGTYLFSDDTYRVDTAREALTFLRSDRNLTAIEDSEFMLAAEGIASAENSRLFQGIDPTPLDDEPPVVTLNHANYEYFGGNDTYSVSASDYTGIKYIDLWVSDQYIGRKSGVETAEFVLPTMDFSDGQHTVEILAVDNQYKETRVEQVINIWNASPIVTLLSDRRTNQLDESVVVGFSSPVGVVSAEIGGVPVDVVDGVATAEITLNPGYNQVIATATDGLGRTTNDTVEIYVDRVKPVMKLDTPNTYYEVDYSASADENHTYSSVLNLGANAPDPLYIDSSLVSLDGTPLSAGALGTAKYPFIEFLTTDDLGTQDPAVITPGKDIVVSFSYFRDDSIVFERKPLAALSSEGVGANQYILPLTSEYLGEGWFLHPDTTKHSLKIYLEDLAGNESFYDFQFYVRYFPDAPTIAVTDVTTRYIHDSLDSLPVEGDKERVAQAVFFNPNPFPVKVVFSNIGENQFEQNRQAGIRVNKLEKRIVSTATAKCASFSQTALPAGSGETSEVRHHGASASFSHSSGETVSLVPNDYVGYRSGSSFVQETLVSMGHVGDVTTEIFYNGDVAPLTEELTFKPTIQSSVSGATTLLSGGAAYTIGGVFHDKRYYQVRSHGALLTRVGNRWGCPLQSVNSGEVYWKDLFTSYTTTGGNAGLGTLDYTRHSFSSKPITVEQTITYGGVQGYPRNELTPSSDTQSTALELRSLDDQVLSEVVLQPGDNSLDIVATFPGYSSISTDCDWEYENSKTCTTNIDVRSLVEIDYLLSTYLENDPMPSYGVATDVVEFTTRID
ncbi:hypothetical protein [Reinekea blandensis]|uniref:Bacterial Ig-like domain-containing protein n=1 Tax=Reinekea blandensis MED297 TaxID=314283 RepID=A4BJY3_9GAMM|nr:hypothetical protein [Reinekea blandensis]EAR07584.1 hypothetical protein MED297_00145 [Reinekea sp. MED297] [Reinekea blandensis MED297]